MNVQKMAETYIGFRSVWQQIQDKLHPLIVSKLEYLIGPDIIEDSVLHFAEAQNLAEILVQKVVNINSVLLDAEETEKSLFSNVNPSFFQAYTADVLSHPKLQKYVEKATQVHNFLQTQTIQKFKNATKNVTEQELPPKTPLQRELNNPDEMQLTEEFVEKIRQILKLEHKELDQRIQYLQSNIYNNHKLERIARGVYKQFQEANASVDVAQLKKFQEYLHSKQPVEGKINSQPSQPIPDVVSSQKCHQDLHLTDLQHNIFQSTTREPCTTDSDFDERLCQSVRARRPRTKRLELDGRPETGASLRQSIKLPPKPLNSLVQSKLD